MSVKERDPYTGHMTTGHVWDGIKELNTPVPRIIFYCLGATFIFSVVYWVLMPAWPGLNDYTKGVWGVDQQDTISQQQKETQKYKETWTLPIESKSFAEIAKDPDLMEIVAESGPSLFTDNCAMCHGSQGQGAPYFPTLNDSSWLWGGEPEQILKTLQVGINSGHPDSRIGNMPALGRDGALDSESVKNVSMYVQSLTNSHIGDGSLATELIAVQAGKKVFTTLCVACHGLDGKGNIALGAPNLVDNTWLYGSDLDTLYKTIWNGRAGVMPAWSERLSPAELRILALYVVQLGQQIPDADSESGGKAEAENNSAKGG